MALALFLIVSFIAVYGIVLVSLLQFFSIEQEISLKALKELL